MKLPKICEKINPKNKILYQQGCECTYIPCNNGWGIKLFSAKKNRDLAVKNQKKLNKFGLAPKVGKVFTLEIDKKNATDLYYERKGNKAVLYAYITQSAQMSGFYSEEHNKNLKNLRHKLKQKGYNFSDCGFHNAGYINNRLVVVDCNAMSFTDEYWSDDE